MTTGHRRRLIIQSSLFCTAVLAGWLTKQAWPASDHPGSDVSQPPPATVSDLDDWSDSITTAEAVANDLSAPDPAPASKIAARLLELETRDGPIWAAVFAAWCTTAPEDAWAFAQENSDAIYQTNLPKIALEQWAKADPVAARAAIPDPTPEQFATLIRGAMAADVEIGFALLDDAYRKGLAPSGDPFQNQSWAQEENLEALARKNPKVALAWAERLDDSDLLGPVLSGWWKRDPTEVRHWLSQQANREEVLMDAGWFLSNHAEAYDPEIMDFVLTSLPPGNLKSEMLQQTIETLAYRDPDVALRETNRLLTDPANRAEAIGKIAHIVARTHFSNAWGILDGLEPSVLSIRRVSVPGAELSADGKFEEHGGPSRYQWDLTSMRGLESPAAVRSRLLTNLLMVDKQAALKFMEGLPPDQLTQVGEDAIERWAWRDPEEAAVWLAGRMGDSGNIHEVTGWFSQVDESSNELLNLVSSLPQGTVRSALAMDMVSDLAATNPQAALDLARDSGAAPELIREVYYEWSSSDPKAALHHIATNESAPPEAWEIVVKKAFDQAPEEAVRAVDALPAGTARDTAVTEIVKEVMTNPDPVPATEWALSIDVPTTRRKAIKSILERTTMDLRLTRDPEVAGAMRELLSSSTALPDEERDRWLQRIETEFHQP